MPAKALTLQQPITEARLPTKFVVLDIVERCIVFCFFGYFGIRNYEKLEATHDLRTLLLLFSEVLPFIFILARPLASAVSIRPSDWAIGLTCSIGPMMITMAPINPIVPSYLWYSLTIGGMCIQLSAKVFLGLSYGVIAANRGVKVGGPYSVVRHPMYAGYTISHVGIMLGMPSLTNAILYAIVLAMQIVRMGREEAILSKDERYREFAARVRYRLLPGVY